MSMQLTPDDLRRIADAVEEAGKASFTVESLRVAGHGVMLKLVTTPPVGAGQIAYKVVGITAGGWSGHATRGVS